jgi:hypothetical protein
MAGSRRQYGSRTWDAGTRYSGLLRLTPGLTGAQLARIWGTRGHMHLAHAWFTPWLASGSPLARDTTAEDGRLPASWPQP